MSLVENLRITSENEPPRLVNSANERTNKPFGNKSLSEVLEMFVVVWAIGRTSRRNSAKNILSYYAFINKRT